jgi:DNA-directed RNA polymerase subunit RPC12/RpoP
MAETVMFKCPHCGGDLKFDPAGGKYTCEYCKSVFSQEELDRIEAAEKAKNAASGSTQNAGENTTAGEAVVYHCPSCGAEIVTDENTAATFCFYCHNPIVLSGRLEGGNMPDYVLPFKITRDKAVGIFTDWIKGKKFVPKSFWNKDQIDKMTGVYFPYFLYSCKIAGHIDGEATKTTVSRNGNVEATTRETYHVQRQGNMEVKHVIRCALSKENKILAEGVQPFDFEGLQPFKMSYLSGFQAEKKDLAENDFHDDVEKEVHDYALQQLENSVAGYENLTITDDAIELTDPEWRYALMPVWTVTYKDRSTSKIYYFSVNGQSGKVIGELPLDKGRLVSMFFKIFIPMAAALLIAGYFL